MNANHVAPKHRSLTRRTRLAIVVTAAAASVAWFLSAVAELSEQAVVISVMTIAFVASWVVTNTKLDGRRIGSGHRSHLHHRVTMIPIRTDAR